MIWDCVSIPFVHRQLSKHRHERQPVVMVVVRQQTWHSNLNFWESRDCRAQQLCRDCRAQPITGRRTDEFSCAQLLQGIEVQETGTSAL
jgi:hypothetical protein